MNWNNLNDLKIEALKYGTKREMKKYSSGAYKAAHRLFPHHLSLIFEHMNHKVNKRTTLQDQLLKINSERELLANVALYHKARRQNLIEADFLKKHTRHFEEYRPASVAHEIILNEFMEKKNSSFLKIKLNPRNHCRYHLRKNGWTLSEVFQPSEYVFRNSEFVGFELVSPEGDSLMLQAGYWLKDKHTLINSFTLPTGEDELAFFNSFYELFITHFKKT